MFITYSYHILAIIHHLWMQWKKKHVEIYVSNVLPNLTHRLY